MQVAISLPDAIQTSPFTVTDKEPPQAIRDGIVKELRHFEHLSGDLCNMFRKRVKLDFLAEAGARLSNRAPKKVGFTSRPTSGGRYNF